MSLQVIGGALGRTGSHSLAQALEILGFGPVYHMGVLSRHPDHRNFWGLAMEGRLVDWKRPFHGYRASVEWPGAVFLLEYYLREGWEPICRFLNRPVPAIPFPHKNQRDHFLSQAPEWIQERWA